jgi:hypothetical protein
MLTSWWLDPIGGRALGSAGALVPAARLSRDTRARLRRALVTPELVALGAQLRPVVLLGRAQTGSYVIAKMSGLQG